MSKGNRYRLVGLEYVHDSRGKYIVDGGIAVLDPDRARKIIGALERTGRGDTLVLIEETDSVSPTQNTEDAGKQGVDDSVLSASVVDAVLARHFTVKRKIASKIAGRSLPNKREVHKAIREATEDELNKAIEAVEAAQEG